MLFWLFYKFADLLMWGVLKFVKVWTFVIGSPGNRLFPRL